MRNAQKKQGPVKAFEKHWAPEEVSDCRFNLMLTAGDVAWLRAIEKAFQ